MQFKFRSLAAGFILLYAGFCGCDSAQSKNVPSGFGYSEFNEIVRYAVGHYLDPQGIDFARSYVGAAEAALKSLPYPLMLMTREYHANRDKVRDALRIVPGKPVELDGPKKGYFIFVPDYTELENLNKKRQDQERNELAKLSEVERAKIFEQQKERLQKEQAFIEKTWKAISFAKKDYEDIVAWIDASKGNYSQLPSTSKGENPFEKDPFGMHHVHFAAANGFLNAMDPHSGVMDKDSWNRIRRESQDSSFEGIGAILRGGGTQDVVVETPLPGSPALNAGLRAGDIIRKVDGKEVGSLLLSAVVKRIRGKKDTTVNLFVERPVELRSLDVKIKRGLIVIKAVSSKYMSKENVGVIKLSSFLYEDENPSALVKREYRHLMRAAKKNLSGLVIDLRNNPGGDLDEAIRTTGLFLPEGVVVVRIKGREGTEDRKNSSEPIIPMSGNFPKIPIIVLINAGSASASEILASALMDHNAALVLGERSFGKASVQGLRPYGDVFIKLTTARYYAPKDYTIQVQGVVPDIRVSDEPDGTFRPHFREEDMWKHLPELETRKEDAPRRAWLARLKGAVGGNAAAEQYLAKHGKDALKPDYMLVRAMSYLEAMRRRPHP